MLKRRTSGHSGANTGPGRSQLFSQAFQASYKASVSTPGNSLQGTATQRLLPCCRLGKPETLCGSAAAEGSGMATLVGAAGTDDTGGLLAQAANSSVTAAIKLCNKL